MTLDRRSFLTALGLAAPAAKAAEKVAVKSAKFAPAQHGLTVPTRGQVELLNSKPYVTVVRGGFGSGKSTGLLFWAAHHAANPRYRAAIVFPSAHAAVDHCERAAALKLRPVRFMRSSNELRFPSGARVSFAAAGDIQRFLGCDLHRIAFDDADDLDHGDYLRWLHQSRASREMMRDGVFPQIAIAFRMSEPRPRPNPSKVGISSEGWVLHPDVYGRVGLVVL